MQKYLLILLAVLWLSGCAKESLKDGISEQEAIEAALKIALESRPEMSAAQVTPSNIQAEQMSFDEATKRIQELNEVPSGYSPDLPVWLVTMDGIWLDLYGTSAGLPTPEPYRHMMIILDAKTGLELESGARP